MKIFRSLKYNPSVYILGIFICFLSCDESFDPIRINSASEHELLLEGTWQYDSVSIAGLTFLQMTRSFEPLPDLEFLPPAVDISRRFLHYDLDHSYQFRYEDEIGYFFDSLNWQPSFGAWKLNNDGTMLTHNPVQTYSKEYEVLHLDAALFTRKSLRFMEKTADSSLWLPGDILEWTEYFSKKD